MSSFRVVYVAGGELEKVKKVNYVDRIHNFAYLDRPYNKMTFMNIPAIAGVYDLEWQSPAEECELLSIVVTCTGYGENDYYNIWVNEELWFDTWFPTEVKEGLYIGTSNYVYVLPASSLIKMSYVNMSGTAKRVWLGVRLLKERPETDQSIAMLDVNAITPSSRDLTEEDTSVIDNSTTY